MQGGGVGFTHVGGWEGLPKSLREYGFDSNVVGRHCRVLNRLVQMDGGPGCYWWTWRQILLIGWLWQVRVWVFEFELRCCTGPGKPNSWPPRVQAVTTGEELKMRMAERSQQAGSLSKDVSVHKSVQRWRASWRKTEGRAQTETWGVRRTPLCMFHCLWESWELGVTVWELGSFNFLHEPVLGGLYRVSLRNCHLVLIVILLHFIVLNYQTLELEVTFEQFFSLLVPHSNQLSNLSFPQLYDFFFFLVI